MFHPLISLVSQFCITLAHTIRNTYISTNKEQVSLLDGYTCVFKEELTNLPYNEKKRDYIFGIIYNGHNRVQVCVANKQ